MNLSCVSIFLTAIVLQDASAQQCFPLLSDSPSIASNKLVGTGAPFNSAAAQQKFQSLYLADDLAKARVPAGAEIKSIMLKVTQAPASTLSDFSVGYKFTDKEEETPTAFELTDPISGPPSKMSPQELQAGHWKTLQFTSAVHWNGKDNLVLELSSENEACGASHRGCGQAGAGGVELRQTPGHKRSWLDWADVPSAGFPVSDTKPRGVIEAALGIQVCVDDSLLVINPSSDDNGQPSTVIADKAFKVRWYSQGDLGPLRIELHNNWRQTAYWLLTDAAPDTGSWDWFVQSGGYGSGGLYRLKLVSTANPDVHAWSSYFVVKGEPTLYISWVFLMAAMTGTICCLLSVCRVIRHTYLFERRSRNRTTADNQDEEANEDEEGEGEGEEGETSQEPSWKPGPPPEELLEAVTLARFQCCVCMEHSIDTVFVPCGHQVCCGGCSKNLDLCPICRAEVGQVVKVWHK